MTTYILLDSTATTLIHNEWENTENTTCVAPGSEKEPYTSATEDGLLDGIVVTAKKS